MPNIDRPILVARLTTHRLAAFTLIELIVVIAIIAILLSLVVPGVSSIWQQRGEADSINTIRGLLESARARAIQKGEYGLFFFVDKTGVQRVTFIEAAPGQAGDPVTPPMAVNRFRVVGGQLFSLPTPYRAAADWVIEWQQVGANQVPTYPNEMTVTRFANASGADTPRYHRNFFTVVFNRNGQMVAGREVLLQDSDLDNNDLGDVTGMVVPPSPSPGVPGPVDEYWRFDSVNGPSATGIGVNPGDALFDLILLSDTRAANFVSVSGVVVYDDSALEGISAAEMLTVFRESGQALVVSRFTGDVILAERGG